MKAANNIINTLNNIEIEENVKWERNLHNKVVSAMNNFEKQLENASKKTKQASFTKKYKAALESFQGWQEEGEGEMVVMEIDSDIEDME
jgi:hypothetical protein